METTFDTLPRAVDKLLGDVKEIKQLLEKNKSPEKQEPQWFNLAQLCAYLPDQPKPATIYGKISEIPHYKDGKRLRFKKTEIDTWLLKGKRKTHDELDAETNEFLSNHEKRG